MTRYNQILKEIKTQRQLLGISQTDMAVKLNVSQSAYGKIENGKTLISIDRLYEICEKLNLNMFDLLRLVFGKDETVLRLTADRNQAERYLEINQKWFLVVESMIASLGEKIDICLLPDSESKRPLILRVEDLLKKYQDLLNTVDVYKIGMLPTVSEEELNKLIG